MKKRLVSELKKVVPVAAAGILYYFAAVCTGMGFPCIFHAVTGLFCPACGVTRMLGAMGKLHFYEAYGYNKAVFLTWPFIAAVLAAEEIRYIKTGSQNMHKVSKLILWGEAGTLVLFGIVRNII